MKKSILIFGFALALASCASDSYEGWSDPQHSDPEASKDVKLAIGNAPAINFGTLTADSVQLFVPKVTTTNTTASSYYTVAVNDGEKANASRLRRPPRRRPRVQDGQRRALLHFHAL